MQHSAATGEPNNLFVSLVAGVGSIGQLVLAAARRIWTHRRRGAEDDAADRSHSRAPTQARRGGGVVD